VRTIGKVAQTIRAKAKRVQPEMNRARGDIAKILVQGLREAVDAELYQVSKGPLTGRMKRSIRPRMLGNDTAAVGFDLKAAPYAVIRLKKRGRSKLYGHNMNMDPAAWIRKNKMKEIHAAGAKALKRIAQ
jgi:hypothetical protein